MSIFKDLLATMPFFSPSQSRFRNRATQTGVIGNIPFAGPTARAFPFVSFIDDHLKYPLLVLGRLFVSFAVTILLCQFSLSEPWKDFTKQAILPIMAPAPIKGTPKKTDNFFQNIYEEGVVESKYAADQANHKIWESAVNEALTGAIALPFRAVGIYGFIYLLYLAFGNALPQLERKYLQKTGELTEFGRDSIFLISSMLNNNQLLPQDGKRLFELTKMVKDGGGISKDDRLFLRQLSERYILKSPNLGLGR